MSTQNRKTKRIEINNADQGLGIKIIGGAHLRSGIKQCIDHKPDFGLFIKRLVPGGALFNYKSINPGDQILEVNDICLEGSTYSRAINILRVACKNSFMSIVLSSDEIARSEYAKLIEWKETMAEKKLKNMGKSESDNTNVKNSSENSVKLELNTTSCDCYKKNVEIIKSAAGLGLRVKTLSDPKQVQLARMHHLSCFEILPLSSGGDASESKSLRGGDLLFSFNDELLDGLSVEQINCLLLREKLRPEKSLQLGYISANDVDSFIQCIHEHGAGDTSRDCSSISSQSLSSEHDVNIENFSSSEPNVIRLNNDSNKEQNEMEDFVNLETKFRHQENENKILCEHMHALMEQQNKSVENMKLMEINTQAEVNSIKREYEEIIRVMQEEMRTLQSGETNLVPSSPQEGDENKQVALLECECRKLTEAKKQQQTQIYQLKSFLSKFITTVTGDDQLLRNNILKNLLLEAQKISIHQEQNLVDDILPYGWEKAILSDGRIFYIDHANHVTSWIPPCGDVTKLSPESGALEQAPLFIDEEPRDEALHYTNDEQTKISNSVKKQQTHEVCDISDIDFTHCYANLPSSSPSPEML